MKNNYLHLFLKLTWIVCPLLISMQAGAQSTNPSPYCYPTAGAMSSGTCTGTGGANGYGYSLKSVKFDSVFITSGCYGSSSSDVYRYWNQNTTVIKGYTYRLEIATPAGSGTLNMNAGAWIDFDQDNQFDSAEFIQKFTLKNWGGTISGNIVIPCTASIGTTRMRVRIQSATFFAHELHPNHGCAIPSGFGETWDFNLTITQPTSNSVGFSAPTSVFVKNIANFVNINRAGYINQWDANNDGTIEAPNSVDFNYTWTSAGTKCIKLSSTNCFGKDTLLKCINVVSPTAKPVAKFESCIRAVEQYGSVRLSDLSTNGPWAWTWDVYDSTTYASQGYYPNLSDGDLYSDPWGNGNNEFAKNPEFAFDIPGLYTVILKAKNDVGTTMVTKKSYIRVYMPTDFMLGYGTYGPNNNNLEVSHNYGSLYDNGGPNLNYGNKQGVKTKSFLSMEPAAGGPITLRFEQIRLNDNRDTIMVYDDNKINPSKLLATYTSAHNGTYPVLTSTGDKMFFYFSSDSTGSDSGFYAVFYTGGADPGSKGFGIRHNVLKVGKQSLFYNKFNNQHTWKYSKKWKVDGVVKNAYENQDTFKHVFTDTASHTVCLELFNCDDSFTVCESLQFDKGIEGKVFRDNNSNCALNTGESGIGHVKVSLYDNSNNFLSSRLTAKDGSFDFVEGAGQYKLVLDTLGAFRVNCKYPGIDSAFTLNSGNPLIDNINFAMECKPGFDVGVKSIAVNGIVFPGRHHVLKVIGGDLAKWFGQSCASSLSGQVKISVTGKVAYVNEAYGSLTPSVSGKVFTYSISDFANVDIEKDFGLVFKTDTNANASDTVLVEVKITPTSGDNDSSNNYKRFVYKVVNSYDPNMKEVYPQDVNPGFKDWLTYTVHFQNTGNAPAYDVRLADTLDAQLDLPTFEVLGSSHYVNTSLTGRVLSFTFKDIMLADSFSDEKASHGYVQYRIKPKVGLPLGANIKNTAYIYFDFNEPVVTNTTTNEYVRDNFIVIPDPNFVIWLNANYPSCMRGNKMDTTCTGVKSALSVDVTGKNIQTLEGIQYFRKLTLLNCSGNQLSDLPALPSGLTAFSCSYNQMTQLPALPSGITVLSCSGNKLSQLPTLPTSLVNLFCNENLLTSLPALPASLTKLQIHDNLLTALPVLPAALDELVCSKNQLTGLPALPSSLLMLICYDNKIHAIDAFPSGLQKLVCADNMIKCFPEFPAAMYMISIIGNQFTCLPNYVNAMSTFEKDFPLCKKNDPVGNPNGCLSLITSVGETTVSGIQIYPNPGTGIYQLELSDLKGTGATVEVLNVLGEAVFNTVMNGHSLQIDLRDQPAGIYIVRVNGMNIVWNTILVKQ